MRHSRSSFPRFAFLVMALLGFLPSAWAQGEKLEKKTDIMEIVAATYKVSNEAGELNMIWWMPEEFWKASAESDSKAAPADVETLLKVVRPYVIIGVASGKKGSFGALTYRGEAEIRAIIHVKDSDGGISDPLPEDKVDASVPALLGLMKPMIARMTGPLGENFHFYIFPGHRQDGTRVCNPLVEGSCEVDLGEQIFKWRLPIGSFLPKQKCPHCGEILSGAYKYCPYDGTKLEVSK